MLLRCLNIIGCLLSTYTRTTSPIPANKNRKNTKTKSPKEKKPNTWMHCTKTKKKPKQKKQQKKQTKQCICTRSVRPWLANFLSDPVRLKGTLIIINGDYQ